VDRKGAAVLGVIAAAALLAAAGPDLSVIHAARWLAPGADRARALGSIATECLGMPADAEGAYRVEVGRAAFKSPLLLGGQAARAGLACDSCHQDGRNNPDFFFPGVSGAPGTATRAALLSSHPADGIDHPKPIPNLSGPKSGLKVSQDVKAAALEPFVHGLVTSEFDGAEPPPAVIKGLAAYVRAARRVAGSSRRPGRGRRRGPAGEVNTTEIREWAKTQGIEVKDRGRIPAELVVKFKAASAG